MRSLTLAALALTTLMLSSGAGSAREYPWCLIDGGKDGSGSWSCGYASFEQCMATRIGTDMCNVNPRYAAYPSAPPRKVKRVPVQ